MRHLTSSLLYYICYIPILLLMGFDYILRFLFFITIGWWKSYFFCSLRGHDWYFIGGGWISFEFGKKNSFECKCCKKQVEDIPDNDKYLDMIVEKNKQR